MYIDEQVLVPRRMKWRHDGCVGGGRGPDVLLLMAFCTTSRQENVVNNFSWRITQSNEL